MNSNNYIIAVLLALTLSSLNSWYWYKQGYRGGKLFFLGTIGFFGIIMLIMKLFM